MMENSGGVWPRSEPEPIVDAKLAITTSELILDGFLVSEDVLYSIFLHTIHSHGVQGGVRRIVGHGYSPEQNRVQELVHAGFGGAQVSGSRRGEPQMDAPITETRPGKEAFPSESDSYFPLLGHSP